MTSVKAVEKGMVIADQTATQLEDVADNSRTITEQVGNIADTLETQTTAIHQINEVSIRTADSFAACALWSASTVT